MTHYLVLTDRDEYVEAYNLANHSVTVTSDKVDAKKFTDLITADWIADRVAGFVETVGGERP